jgi:hypothetical protein
MITDEWLSVIGSAAMVAGLLGLLYLLLTIETRQSTPRKQELAVGFFADRSESGELTNIKLDHIALMPGNDLVSIKEIQRVCKQFGAGENEVRRLGKLNSNMYGRSTDE